ncbi:MAG: dTDP-4-dehydrorhamnose reductase [Burkholderiales bacterium]|nr:dTDP-4-dehydrorhamnose reductase [Burkholderiales bacterium]
MRFVVTGVTGQVGWELQRSLQSYGDVVALDRSTLDLSEPEQLSATLRHVEPDVIFNPAAFTAVDLAESRPEVARRVNQDAVGAIAREAAALGALLIHYSTDYVFSGLSEHPYVESDLPDPRSEYGRTKLGGERALAQSQADWLCLRTSWVYGSRGKNFLQTVLRLARERDELRVVADQIGAPTWCRYIADASVRVMVTALEERRQGRFSSEILHLAAAGETSWHEFAEEILRQASALGIKGIRAERVAAISSAQYPTPALRPANSRLNCARIRRRFGVVQPRWQSGVSLCLSDIAVSASKQAMGALDAASCPRL